LRGYTFFTCAQQTDESVDAFLAKLRQLAKSCELKTLEEELLRDMMVVGLNNHALREKLLQIEKLTLPRCIELCRTEELTRQRSSVMKNGNGNGSDHSNIDAIHKKKTYQNKKHGYQNKKQDNKKAKKGSQNSRPNCRFCGHTHKPRQCPAYGKTCKECGKKNHFTSVCETKKFVREINAEDDDDEDDDYDDEDSFRIDCLDKEEKRTRKSRWNEEITFNAKMNINFKIDTGADVNTLPKNLHEQLKNENKLIPNSSNLYNYTRGSVTCMGRTFLPCVIRGKTHVLEFYVIDSNVKPVIGWESAEDTGLVIRIDQLHLQANSAKAATSVSLPRKFLEFKECFQGVGQFKDEYRIVLKDNVKPVVHAPRKVPLALKPLLKQELDNMERDGIIEKAQGPTDWVNSTKRMES